MIQNTNHTGLILSGSGRETPQLHVPIGHASPRRSRIRQVRLIFIGALVLALAGPARASLEWNFGSSNNGLNPAADVGTGTGSIALGDFGTGWHDASLELGSRQGYWDLGRDGSFTIQAPVAALGGPGGSAALTVVQFIDELYNGALTYNVPGATQVGNETIALLESTSPLGQWLAYTTIWKFDDLAGTAAIRIAAPDGGAVIDQVTLQSSIVAVPEPSTLFAGALLLLPLGISAIRTLSRGRRLKEPSDGGFDASTGPVEAGEVLPPAVSLPPAQAPRQP